jgi:hypothetical protein
VIHWPSGAQQVIRNPAVDEFHTIVEPRR